MHFPRLPLLEHTLAQFGPSERRKLQRVSIVGVQHILESNGSLFEALLRGGARPDYLILSGKFYSTHERTWQQLRDMGIQMMPAATPISSWRYSARANTETTRLWNAVRASTAYDPPELIIVLDDGGFCLRAIPKVLRDSVPIVGIEQTMSGLRLAHGTQRAPIIQVALSAAKRHLESPMIAAAVAEKMTPLPSEERVIGIAGLGNIGYAVATYWQNRNKRLIVFDRRKAALSRYRSRFANSAITLTDNIDELLQQADVIYGCTGRDFMCGNVGKLRRRRGRPLRLASCSSRDIEFLALLERYYSANPGQGVDLQPIHFSIADTPITIERSGYPVNFDGTAESVPSPAIQLTRSLMLSAILQALRLKFPAEFSQFPLAANMQKDVVQAWRRAEPEYEKLYDPSILAGFEFESWIHQQSSSAAPTPQ